MYRKTLVSELKARDAKISLRKILNIARIVQHDTKPCKHSYTSCKVSHPLDGCYDENPPSSWFYSFETYWYFYRFYAWTGEFKCQGRH